MLLEQYIDYSLKSYLSEEEIQKELEASGLQLIQRIYRVNETEGWILKYRDTRNLIVTCRGTDSFNDVVYNASFFLTDFPGVGGGKVHTGFWRHYQDVRESLREKVAQHALEDCDSITFVGHSLGASICVFAALDCVMGRFADKKVRCITIGAPKIGDRQFCKVFKERVPDTYRIVNPYDIVPKLPTFFLYHTHGELMLPVPDDCASAPPCFLHIPRFYDYLVKQHSLYTYMTLAKDQSIP